MRRKATCIGSAAVIVVLAVTATASAETTLGSVAPPAGSTSGICSAFVIAPLVSATGVSFTVPAGGGAITQWQTNTTGATPGDAVTFVVVRPTGANSYSVVGDDSEVLPNPLPADNVASFTLSAPITVSAGDALSLASPVFQSCFWTGGSTPSADGLVALSPNGPLAPGQTLTPTDVGPTSVLNVAATLSVREDAGVSASAVPGTVPVGGRAVLTSLVSNGGPSSTPITVVDAVPPGLTINSVAVGSGSCSTSGQLVTCTISGLAPGQSVPLDIVVTPKSAQQYTNAVSSPPANGVPDPNPANNSATAILTAQSVTTPTARCVVPNLIGVPSRAAKTVLGLLDCKVGKVTSAHSKLVATGAVIKTTPRVGTYAGGAVVGVQVSTGPPRHHPKRRRHKHH